MPSQRKRIGFLPSQEVHDIIEKLCITSEYSQSKVTGLLVEEALRSRGVLDDSFSNRASHTNDYFGNSLQHEPSLNNNKSLRNNDPNSVRPNSLSDDIKMMHEFIEFKHFKKIMKQNKNILE